MNNGYKLGKEITHDDGISKAIFVGDDGMEIEEQFVHNKEDIRVLNK